MHSVPMRGTAGELTLRALERERVRLRNEPPARTLGEEIFNSVSHGVGGLLAVAGMVLLLLRSETGLEIMASCFYGISMIVMMGSSGLYHALKTGSAAKRICRRFDYTSIYLLIGGTFAPILLIYLGGIWGVALFCIQWAVILGGVILVLTFGPGRWRPLHFTLYFVLGWSGLAFIPEFYRNAPVLLQFIFGGGLLYTLGMIPFGRNRKYDHCVWHLFVVAAAVLHWFGIYTQIYCG
jgi:hemolysin III